MLGAVQTAADTVVIPTDSFASYTSLEEYWAYLYPWGSDHNGSARMVGNSTTHTHISVANGTLTLTATKTTTSQPPSTAAPFPAIHYLSGTVYAKEQVTVGGSGGAPGYTLSGEFLPPTAVGTWPAFWLTAVDGWPPESDVGEWKGTQDVWFNTFNTSSAVASTIVPWPDDGAFHAVGATLRAAGDAGGDVSIEYYLDGVLRATQVGAGFAGKAMWLIIDLQMEGSSGSPGPSGTTTYQVRNVQMTRLSS
ncbi:hypothetical protein DENSPDRAFT_767997 [Dentipellis sp. KUC8613]|nr:hypothetical protein DENSPDRAFT_767997 [Dentipellis sp. KUC8613]